MQRPRKPEVQISEMKNNYEKANAHSTNEANQTSLSSGHNGALLSPPVIMFIPSETYSDKS